MKKLSLFSRLFLSVSGGALFFILANVSFAYSTGEWKNASQIYSSACHYCHDTGVAPQLMGRQLPPSYIALRVRNGFNAMPAFKPSEIGIGDLNILAEWISNSALPDKQAGK